MENRQELLSFVREQSPEGLFPWSAHCAAVGRFGVSHRDLDALVLENGFFPARYQRNRKMLGGEEQLRLLRSRVAVIGCGGLGGYAIEELARLGVGEIIAVDPDIFEEHNLNRQILSTPATLGRAKVEAAVERVREINPAVEISGVQQAFCAANGAELLCGVTVAVDALDSIGYRLELAQLCDQQGIPLVHGAIGGWYGHLTTQLPGDGTVQAIYRHWKAGKGIEQQLGNPSFTPAVVASLQVAEVCKLLLGMGEPLRRRKLGIDLLAMEAHEISYQPQPEQS